MVPKQHNINPDADSLAKNRCKQRVNNLVSITINSITKASLSNNLETAPSESLVLLLRIFVVFPSAQEKTFCSPLDNEYQLAPLVIPSSK